MLIQTELRIADAWSRPFGGYERCPSIDNQPIEKFLTQLKAIDIIILAEQSEKVVKYKRANDENRTVVPFETQFPENIRVNVLEYLFRDGKGIEFVMKDFNEIHSRPMEGIIGGTSSGIAGVSCTFTYRGDENKTYLIEPVYAALRYVYEQKTFSFPEYFKNLDRKKKLRGRG